jgi:hypothetical protein
LFFNKAVNMNHQGTKTPRKAKEACVFLKTLVALPFLVPWCLGGERVFPQPLKPKSSLFNSLFLSLARLFMPLTGC